MERIIVLFVSRRSSLRSVLAEACLMHLDRQRFLAFGCGQPGQVAHTVHPAAIDALNGAGIAVPQSPLHSWNEFIRVGAPRLELVIALDKSIEPLQPPWPGQPDAATWHFPDVAANPDQEEAAKAAVQVLYSLRRRLELLVNLPLRSLDRSAVRSDVRDLGHMN